VRPDNWQQALKEEGMLVTIWLGDLRSRRAFMQIELASPAAGGAKLEQVAMWLASQQETRWVEEEMTYSVQNQGGAAVTQSNSDGEEATPLWDAGLSGRDEIVGCADTGLDIDNCLFHDANPVGPFHRKVVAYANVSGADSLDCVHGHGTHVVSGGGGCSADLFLLHLFNVYKNKKKIQVGSILGKVESWTNCGWNASQEYNVNLFKGVAFNARVWFHNSLVSEARRS